MDKEKKRGFIDKNTFQNAARITLAALVGYAGASYGPMARDELFNNSRTEPVPFSRVSNIQDAENKNFSVWGIEDMEKINRHLMEDYNGAKHSFSDYMNYEIDAGLTEDDKNYITQKRKQLVFEGLDMLLKAEGRLNIRNDYENNVTEINDVIFDLNDTYELFLADALTTQYIDLIYGSLEDNLTKQYEASRNISELLWLAKSELNIKFEDYSYPFPDSQKLLMLARFYMKHNELGYLPSGEILFERSQPGQRPSGLYTYPDEVKIYNRASESTIFHEEAHHQSYTNHEIGQDVFNKILENKFPLSVNSADLGVVPGPGDSIYTGFISGYAMRNSLENYAEVIESYFNNGSEFRLALEELKAHNPDAYKALKAQYEFAKEYFGGEEYSKEGIVFDPKPGQVFKIGLPNRYGKKGYFVASINADSKEIIRDKQTVIVLHDPVGITTESGEDIKLVYIRTGYFNSLEYTLDPGENYSEGWIPYSLLNEQLSFGDILVKKANP